jgi:predicted ATPase
MVWNGEAKKIHILLHTGQCADKAPAEFRYEIDIERAGASSDYWVHTEDLDMRGKRILQRHRVSNAELLGDDGKLSVTIPKEEIPGSESLLAALAGPLTKSTHVRLFQGELAAWGIHPEFAVGRESPARRGAVSRTERRLEWDGSNLISVLHTLYENNRDFKRDIDDGMGAAFSPEFERLSFPPEADQRVQLRVHWKSLRAPLSAADLSDGTLRFLYLLTILANPDPPSLIAIDEPENGLHPSMQQIVAEFAEEAATRSQVVLTTHSPEFLDAFDDVTPTTTVVEWQDGQTTVQNLSGDSLKRWLENFSLGEILRTNEAQAIKKEETK